MPLDSLNPLYTDKDIVVDPTLEGDWLAIDKGEESTLSFVPFQNGKDNGYTLNMRSKDKEGKCSNMEFEGRLVSIGGHKFLDLVPRQWDARSDVYPLHITHSKTGVSIEPALLQLGMASYLEFSAGAQPQARLRPAHWFFRVWTDGKKLRLDWVDDDKFKKAIEQGKFHLSHALLGEAKNKDVVVTASTQELQKFVAEHAEDESLFSEHMTEMTRKAQ
jgi:hypothetical protein